LSAPLLRLPEKAVSKPAVFIRNQSDSVVETSNPELPTQRSGFGVTTASSLVDLAANAALLWLDQGLYALEIDKIPCRAGEVSGLPVPLVQITVPPSGGRPHVEILDSSRGVAWFGQDGGTLILKAPPKGGQVCVTAYGLPGQAVRAPHLEVHRIDGRRSNGTGSSGLIDGPEEVRTEVLLHIERMGDRQFPGKGWVGNCVKKLRIEAFSIRPTEVLAARDVEFKALGPKGRQTPWVTDAKLCGTRGQGLPLIGFAVRLAPHVADQFDVVYQGAFFESGVVGPFRNGELCVSPIGDDPLKAINLQLTRRISQ
jgi:hypothetical protein